MCGQRNEPTVEYENYRTERKDLARHCKPFSEVVEKLSRAPRDQGARRRETGVYVGVHEDFESPSNAGISSVVGFSRASRRGLLNP